MVMTLVILTFVSALVHDPRIVHVMVSSVPSVTETSDSRGKSPGKMKLLF